MITKKQVEAMGAKELVNFVKSNLDAVYGDDEVERKIALERIADYEAGNMDSYARSNLMDNLQIDIILSDICTID